MVECALTLTVKVHYIKEMFVNLTFVPVQSVVYVP